MALPLTAFTRSLRTTAPEKSRLILRSSSLWADTSAMGGSSSDSLTAAPSLEVEVRGERALQRVHRLGVDAPLVRVGDKFLKPELGRAVVVFVGVLAEQHDRALIAVTLVGRLL